MRRPPPLPDRDGVSAARLRIPPGGRWPTVAAFLADRTHGAAEAARRLDAGEVVYADGSVAHSDDACTPGQTLYLYRDLPDEVPVPGDLEVLHADGDIVVADKPHFLATMPRGTHVVQTALVQLRRRLGLPQLSPAHRLDRLTAGVLLFTVRPELRAPYQLLFQRREVVKTYRAVAPVPPGMTPPVTVRSRIVKPAGSVQAVQVPGEVNAVTHVELLRTHGELGVYRLTPETGRTHQLRVHMSGLGAPIVGDRLYPEVGPHRPADFSDPLQLLAASLEFTDPLTGRRRRFESRRRLAREELY